MSQVLGDLRVASVEAWIADEAERQGIAPYMVRYFAGIGPGWEEGVRLGLPSQWRSEWTPYLEQLREQDEAAVLDAPAVTEPLAVAIARRAS